MRPSGVAESPDPADAIVVRGRDPALLAAAVRRLLPSTNLSGRAVVLARLAAPTPASASVVHVVVDAFVEAGCEVSVAGQLASRDRDRGHRSVGALAHAASLTGRTERGRPYAATTVPASSTAGADQCTTSAPSTCGSARTPVASSSARSGRALSR
jgi:hypothetical protein